MNCYFYCQYPIDYVNAFFFVKLLKKRLKSNYILIFSRDDYSKEYDWEFIFREFDKTLEVKKCNIGNISNRINLRGLCFFLLKGLYRSFATKKCFHKISFIENSTLITFGGFSIEKSIFLNLSSSLNESLKTLLIADEFNQFKLDNFRYGIKESIYYNIYQFFHGKKYVDIYLHKSKRQTNHREYRFRKVPANFFYKGEYLFRNLKIGANEMFWPIFQNDNQIFSNKKELIIIGGVYHWTKNIDEDLFYKRYNELLNLLKLQAKGFQLTYINHPSSKEEQKFEINKLDLDGFKIINNMNAESYIYQNNNLIISFSIFSLCLLTLNQMGVESYSLYKFFKKNELSIGLFERLETTFKIDKKFDKIHLDKLYDIKQVFKNFPKLKKRIINKTFISNYNSKLDNIFNLKNT